MRLYNGTPHPINIYSKNSVEFVERIRKFVLKDKNINPTITIQPDKPLNAKLDYIVVDNYNGIDIYQTKVITCDELLDGYDYYIVSQLYVSVCRALNKNISRLLVISQPVYYSVDNPRPVGCLGLAKP